MAQKLPTKLKLLLVAAQALQRPTGYEKAAGQCKRWIRQVCTAAGVPANLCPPTVIDARQCAQWYRENHPEVCNPSSSVPGDILFYEFGHGPHGHVVIRLYGNVAGENSTAHAPEGQEDGRGTRKLVSIGKPSLIVRLWAD